MNPGDDKFQNLDSSCHILWNHHCSRGISWVAFTYVYMSPQTFNQSNELSCFVIQQIRYRHIYSYILLKPAKLWQSTNIGCQELQWFHSKWSIDTKHDNKWPCNFQYNEKIVPDNGRQMKTSIRRSPERWHNNLHVIVIEVATYKDQQRVTRPVI